MSLILLHVAKNLSAVSGFLPLNNCKGFCARVCARMCVSTWRCELRAAGAVKCIEISRANPLSLCISHLLFCRAEYSLSQSLRKLMKSFYIYTHTNTHIPNSSAVSLFHIHTLWLSPSPTQTSHELWLWQQQRPPSHTLSTNLSPSDESLSSLVFPYLSICVCAHVWLCVCAFRNLEHSRYRAI